MSRPKTIELENGTVSLSGFPKEVSEALAEYIRAFGKVNKHAGSSFDCFLKEEHITLDQVKEVAILGAQAGASLATPSLEELPNRAVGIYRDGPLNRVVTVAYNLDTKQALVTDIKGAIDFKDATTQFKMAADKLRFV